MDRGTPLYKTHDFTSWSQGDFVKLSLVNTVCLQMHVYSVLGFWGRIYIKLVVKKSPQDDCKPWPCPWEQWQSKGKIGRNRIIQHSIKYTWLHLVDQQGITRFLSFLIGFMSEIGGVKHHWLNLWLNKSISSCNEKEHIHYVATNVIK